jgi:formate-dependent nitrite reductase membrane component NrfD
MISNEATKRVEALPVYTRLIPERQEITSEYKAQADWKFVEVLSFYLGGVGTGLYLLSQILDYTIGLILGYLLVVVCKNGAHLLASSKPFRAMGVLRKPGTSWISRGAYSIFIFAVLGLVDIAFRTGMATAENAFLTSVVTILTAMAAFFIMAYVGFVFAEARNIGFWNSPVIPVLIICYSFCMGYALLLVLAPFTQNQFDLSAISRQFLLTLAATVLMIFILLTVVKRMTKSAQQAASMLITGKFSMMFGFGVIIAGLLVPICIVGYYLANAATASGSLLSLAGVLTLVGGLLFEMCLVYAGVYRPIVEAE